MKTLQGLNIDSLLHLDEALTKGKLNNIAGAEQLAVVHNGVKVCLKGVLDKYYEQSRSLEEHNPDAIPTILTKKQEAEQWERTGKYLDPR